MRASVVVLVLSALVVGAYRTPDAAGGSGASAGSKIEFIGTKPGGKHVGGFSKFTVDLDPIKDDLAGGKIKVDIDTTSMFTDTPKLTNHLKSPDFFDVKKYPTAKFVSSSIEPQKSGDGTHKITGDLTLHGKTKTISFPAKVAVTQDAVSITSQFTINRHDFGISYGRGKVHDLVTIKTAVRVSRK
jgi:polyisoprenoid-binding protein YceI